MARYNRKNRAIVSGIMVGVATIFALASHFDMEMNEVSSFLVSTLIFFLAIVLAAALALILFKGAAKFLRPADQTPPADSDSEEKQDPDKPPR